MENLVRTISGKLFTFGLNNINDNTVVTVDPETKEVNVFDSEMNSFKNENGRFLESFCANQFIYEVSEGLFGVDLSEIKNQTFVIE